MVAPENVALPACHAVSASIQLALCAALRADGRRGNHLVVPLVRAAP